MSVRKTTTSPLRPDLARAQVKLDGIEDGSIIVDQHGDAWQKGFPGYWYRAFDADGISSFQLAQNVGRFKTLRTGRGAA